MLTELQRLRLFVTLVATVLLMAKAECQVAGLTALPSLSLPASPRAAALGLDIIATPMPTLADAIDNPSLLQPIHNRQASLTYIKIPSSAHFGSIGYSRDLKSHGILLVGLRFASFGAMQGYTAEEVSTGQFTAGDYAFNIGYARPIDSCFTLGAAFLPTLSHYESYTAVTLLLNLALTYTSPNRRFAATMAANSIGAQIITFDNNVDATPLNIGASMAYTLKGAPLTFYLCATQLNHPNLRYEDPLHPSTQIDPFSGETVGTSRMGRITDNIARHAQIGAELKIVRALTLRLGYNYRQAAEMRGADALNTSGISFGFAFAWRGFHFAYAHNNYHYMQAPNYISVTTSLDRFFNKQ